MLAGVLVIFEMVTTHASSIGKFYIYFSILCFVLAIAKPYSMLYVLLFLTCYIDFFKRMMIIGGLPTQVELAFVQATPMLIVLGASLSFVLPIFMGKSLSRSSIISLIISLVFVIVFMSSGGLSGGFLRKAGQAANAGVYSLLLFIVPLILDTAEKRNKFVKCSFLLFVPVAAYMFKHYYYGLANFEYDYLMTGLSQELRIFVDDGAARRYFSTMNSSATVSTMLCIMALYGIVDPNQGSAKHSSLNKFILILVSILFFSAAGLTLARTGWVCGLVAIVSYVFLGSRFRLVIGYSASIFVFLLLVFSADYIIKYRILDDWQQSLVDYFSLSTGSANAERAMVLGTMYDRLSGWRYLATQPLGFPLFGTTFGGVVTVNLVDQYMLGHDIIVNYLSKLGWIPLAFVLSVGWMFVCKLHQFQFSLPKISQEFKLMRYCLASMAGMLTGGLASGAQLFNFPQNFYFWFWLSICLALYQQMRSDKSLHANT